MASSVNEELLDATLMGRLEQLELVTRKIFKGSMKGERRSKRRGESVEFADFRNYVPGDDLRFLDWNVYARLDKLFLKLFLEEEDLHVSILFDTSKSMDWGKPSKSMYVRRIAAALGYIGLCNYDRVSLFGFSDRLSGEMVGVRGRQQTGRMVDFLSRAEPEGGSNISSMCKYYSLRHPQQGVVIVLGDFLDKGGYETGLRYLISRNVELYVIQVLSPEEVDPPLIGDLKLRDVEDGDLAEITATRALIHRYKKNVEAYCQQLREYCTRRGVGYLFATTDVPFDQLVLSYLRTRGLLR